MSKRHEFQRVFQKTSYALPAAMNREIGRVVVRWTYLEHYIQRMIWAIAFDGDKKGASLGRIAIREPSAKESRLELLQWVAEVRNVNLDTRLLRSMKSKVRTLGDKRNLITHGTWTHVAGSGWCAQQTRGTWLEYKDGPKGSKRITPEAVPLSLDDLRTLTAEIESLIENA